MLSFSDKAAQPTAAGSSPRATASAASETICMVDHNPSNSNDSHKARFIPQTSVNHTNTAGKETFSFLPPSSSSVSSAPPPTLATRRESLAIVETNLPLLRAKANAWFAAHGWKESVAHATRKLFASMDHAQDILAEIDVRRQSAREALTQTKKETENRTEETAAAAAAAAAVSDSALDELPMHRQGDLNMYTTEKLLQREIAMLDIRVLELVEQWWKVARKEVQQPIPPPSGNASDGHEEEEEDDDDDDDDDDDEAEDSPSSQPCMDIYEYVQMMSLIAEVLLEDGQMTQDEILDLILEEWSTDAEGGSCLTVSQFYHSLVCLADHWVSSTNVSAYVVFLEQLLMKVTLAVPRVERAKFGGRVRRWKGWPIPVALVHKKIEEYAANVRKTRDEERAALEAAELAAATTAAEARVADRQAAKELTRLLDLEHEAELAQAACETLRAQDASAGEISKAIAKARAVSAQATTERRVAKEAKVRATIAHEHAEEATRSVLIRRRSVAQAAVSDVYSSLQVDIPPQGVTQASSEVTSPLSHHVPPQPRLARRRSSVLFGLRRASVSSVALDEDDAIEIPHGRSPQSGQEVSRARRTHRSVIFPNLSSLSEEQDEDNSDEDSSESDEGVNGEENKVVCASPSPVLSESSDVTNSDSPYVGGLTEPDTQSKALSPSAEHSTASTSIANDVIRSALKASLSRDAAMSKLLQERMNRFEDKMKSLKATRSSQSMLREPHSVSTSLHSPLISMRTMQSPRSSQPSSKAKGSSDLLNWTERSDSTIANVDGSVEHVIDARAGSLLPDDQGGVSWSQRFSHRNHSEFSPARPRQVTAGGMSARLARAREAYYRRKGGSISSPKEETQSAHQKSSPISEVPLATASELFQCVEHFQKLVHPGQHPEASLESESCGKAPVDISPAVAYSLKQQISEVLVSPAVQDPILKRIIDSLDQVISYSQEHNAAVGSSAQAPQGSLRNDGAVSDDAVVESKSQDSPEKSATAQNTNVDQITSQISYILSSILSKRNDCDPHVQSSPRMDIAPRDDPAVSANAPSPPQLNVMDPKYPGPAGQAAAQQQETWNPFRDAPADLRDVDEILKGKLNVAAVVLVPEQQQTKGLMFDASRRLVTSSCKELSLAKNLRLQLVMDSKTSSKESKRLPIMKSSAKDMQPKQRFPSASALQSALLVSKTAPRGPWDGGAYPPRRRGAHRGFVQTNDAHAQAQRRARRQRKTQIQMSEMPRRVPRSFQRLHIATGANVFGPTAKTDPVALAAQIRRRKRLGLL